MFLTVQWSKVDINSMEINANVQSDKTQDVYDAKSKYRESKFNHE